MIHHPPFENPNIILRQKNKEFHKNKYVLKLMKALRKEPDTATDSMADRVYA
jgi:hypothetical protein